MMANSIDTLLDEFQKGTISKNDIKRLILGIDNLHFAQVDIDRQQRTGQAECIFGQGKTSEQITAISAALYHQNQPILVTRVDNAKAEQICSSLPYLSYNSLGQTLSWRPNIPIRSENKVCVICAGTSDLPVAEECISTLWVNGHIPARQTDIGVAGLHRLLNALPSIKQYDVLIVIAGMEGALPSVIAGLCPQPIIAVPTSIGYGAHQNGLTTLHAMLSSCASGLTVVNIDNGYGAACSALRILETLIAPQKNNL